MGNITICNAQVVLPDRILHGDVLIKEGKIAGVVPANASSFREDAPIYNAGGNYLLPGFIDIHSDAVEKEIQPRPNTLFPMDFAFYELEKKLAASGITTMYHSLSLGVGLSLRGDDLLVRLVDVISGYRPKRSMIRHRIHLRYEISHLSGLPLVKQLILSGNVDYLSYMNHSPGQGQYRKPGSFEAYVMKNQGVDRDEVREIVAKLLERQRQIDWNGLRELAELAARRNIPLASHDDDSADKIDEALALGMSVSEFPLNLDTAKYAKQRNMHVCVGSPNIVRGGSHDNNMRAMDAIAAGAADILCSDYYPSSLLLAVFKIAEEGYPLYQAVNMASLNPAIALKTDRQFGSIEPGKSADLTVVELIDGYPFVRRTWVEGKVVYEADFFHSSS